jgi:hypothetical protein
MRRAHQLQLQPAQLCLEFDHGCGGFAMTTTIYVNGPVDVVPSGGRTDTVASAITATGTTQATATALTAQFTEVTTCPPGAGVVFSSSLMVAGNACKVRNSTTNPLYVYPPSGAAINVLATNTPVIAPARNTAVFEVISATQIYTVP